MEDYRLIEYLMYTPLERLPVMPNTIENSQNTQLGLDILGLLNEKKIIIKEMDSNGFLHVQSCN